VENDFTHKTYDVSAIIIVVVSLITGLMVSLGMMPNITQLYQAKVKAFPIF